VKTVGRSAARKRRRLAMIGVALGTAGLALGLALFALRDTIVFFYGPTEVAAKTLAPGTRLRIGGLVKPGSLQRDGAHVAFAVTDMTHDVEVTYTGLLPDLFREGQGVVAEGSIGAGNVLAADTILAKHDERYMPRDVADALKKQGVWQEGGGAPAATATGPQAAR
jgi:cytochrome c-type biogenesis protein CcmE